jgi:hypothetical protein
MVEYPADEWYTDVAVVDVSNGGVEKATARAREAAIGNVSTKIRSDVGSRKTSAAISTSANNLDDQVQSMFSSATRTISQTSVVGVGVETHHNKTEGAVYAFAYIRRSDLINYYQNQVALHLNTIESALQSAAALVQQGDKAKARKECRQAEPLFDKVAYAQDLLTAVAPDGAGTAAQARGAALKGKLNEMLNALESGMFVYIKSPEDKADFAAQVSGLLTEGG